MQYQHKILLTSDERKNVRKMHYTQVYYLYKNKKYTQNLWKYYAFYGVAKSNSYLYPGAFIFVLVSQVNTYYKIYMYRVNDVLYLKQNANRCQNFAIKLILVNNDLFMILLHWRHFVYIHSVLYKLKLNWLLSPFLDYKGGASNVEGSSYSWR